MTNTADFVITDIKNNDNNVLIFAKLCTLNGDVLGQKKEYSKQQIISFIEKGSLIKTAYEKPSKNWTIGSIVYVIEIHGSKYLRTDKNKISEDNLDNLPKYY